MIRSRKFRMLAVSSMVAGGVMSATLVGAFTGTAGAAQSFKVKLTPDIVAASAAGSPAGAATALKISQLQQNPNYVPGDLVVVVECNDNVLGGDPGACNQSPMNVGQPGGPWLAKLTTKKGAVTAKANLALVSGTVGDGSCSAGQVCFLLVQSVNPVTQMPDGNPITLQPFAINPAA
jgi:hypothetical protein